MTDLQAPRVNVLDLTMEERREYFESRYGYELPLGDIIAAEVPLKEYLRHYAPHHCEWVEGFVIQMGSDIHHTNLIYFIFQFFSAFFELQPIGKVIGQPFVMKLPLFPKRRRQPDLMIVLKNNSAEVTRTMLKGAADICIEVISEESVGRDLGEKFHEYETSGVREYWVLDPIRRQPSFYRLNADGRYIRQELTANGDYVTPLLPRFRLPIAQLWADELPGTLSVARMVNALWDDAE